MKLARVLTQGAATLATLVALSSSAYAQACTGVEVRVNARTVQLTTAITAQITARTAALNAQEVIERQRLLSALRVLTKQLSTSASQEVAAEEAASRGVAQTIVEQSVNDQVREAVRDYGNTGYNACGAVELGNDVADAVANAETASETIAEQLRVRHSASTSDDHAEQLQRFTELAQTSDGLTAAVLQNGTDEEVEQFVALVLGPPRPPVESGAGEFAQRVDRAAALQHMSRQSIAAKVMSEAATSERIDQTLNAMINQWTAEGQAEAWAARQVTSPTRGVLLDVARIEAANVALAANSVRREFMEEFALAGFALSFADTIVNGADQ